MEVAGKSGGGHGGHRAAAIVERIKELDLEHRNRLVPSGLAGALGMRLLRLYVERLWNGVERLSVKPVARPQDRSMLVAFVGHATCQLVTARTRALIDPMFGNSLGGFRRPIAAAIDDNDLADVNLVLITHGRADRFHPRSLRRLPRSAVVVVPAGCARAVERLGFRRIREVAPGDTIENQDLEMDLDISVVPARHDGVGIIPGRWRHGHGYVVQSPEVAVYASGPTGYFSGFADIGRRLRPDVALLPIAGYQPDSLRSGNLSPLDAAYALEDLRARLMVPVAYGAFPLGYEPLAEPLEWLRSVCADRGQDQSLAVLGPGEILRVQRQPG